MEFCTYVNDYTPPPLKRLLKHILRICQFYAGKSTASKIAIIEITTRSSTSVKPYLIILLIIQKPFANFSETFR